MTAHAPSDVRSSSRAGRRTGGRRSGQRRFAWRGLGLELACWRPGPASDGWVCLDDHMVFVTLSGTTDRTETTLEGAGRYRGADFPGAVSFVPARRPRRAWHSGGRIDYAAIRLDAGAVAHVLGDPELRGFTNRADPLIRDLAIALRDEALGGGVRGPMFVETVSRGLTSHLMRTCSELAPGVPGRTRPLDGAALARVVAHINENLDAELRLSTLACLAGMGQFHFGRAFKAAFGTPPYRYVMERRVERAAELLAGTDLPIGMITHQVGLSSQSHLTTLFRKLKGITPHAYRLEQRR
jgi:AraC family transcriptional regulator